MSAILLPPAIGNLQLIGFISPTGGFVDPINDPIGPGLGVIASDDNYYNGELGVASLQYASLGVSGSVSFPTESIPYGDIWFMSIWVPIAVEITYDIVRYHLGVEVSRSSVSVLMNTIDTWVYGGTLAEAAPDFSKDLDLFKIKWPSSAA